MTALVTWLVQAFAPGWPERFAHGVAVALLAAAAVLVAFALAEESSLRGRARAVVRSWARSAAETTTVETRRDGTTVARTTTEQTARHLLFAVIHEEDL
ncbi:hypothetical protein [Streptosporangium roseum]|uniref:Uncharacterized protein n=1 Tax=Streptosporangium roseum (strain ATCC 12428 / DSM 43021 / JCM 3005 / KCTC 9067 / NCIMB 10171 / NRRL 2505 / NI 9100) TaxID=479432 RepID=D2BFW1_STRRD|nr:hypothetical protein [Streptosporangium roseum]ACZ92013.1 hypothetical protein Sros_9395 [Streptosporangium roseum DSM 43021]